MGIALSMREEECKLDICGKTSRKDTSEKTGRCVNNIKMDLRG
jgi:hypothetical protein